MTGASQSPLAEFESLKPSLDRSVHFATVADVPHFKVDGHHGRRRVVLNIGEACRCRLTGDQRFRSRAHILEVGDLAIVRPHRVVGQADVEEARVLLGRESVHVVLRWPHVHHVPGGDLHLV